MVLQEYMPMVCPLRQRTRLSEERRVVGGLLRERRRDMEFDRLRERRRVMEWERLRERRRGDMWSR